MTDSKKDLFGAVKFALQEICADIVSRLPSGRGYELLRLLALKFDSVMPHLHQMLMSSIYGLVSDKRSVEDCTHREYLRRHG